MPNASGIPAGVRKSPAESDALRESYHEIANNLSLLASFVRLRSASLSKQNRSQSPDDVRFLLEEIAARINAISRVHHRVSGDPQRMIEVGECLRETCAALTSALSFRRRVALDYDIAKDCFVRAQRAIPVAMIVCEIVSNAIRHAHADGTAVKIRLGCKVFEDGAAIIDLDDDGVGLPPEFDVAVDGATGFAITRALAKQLGATLAFESNAPGLKVRLALPSDAEVRRL